MTRSVVVQGWRSILSRRKFCSSVRSIKSAKDSETFKASILLSMTTSILDRIDELFMISAIVSKQIDETDDFAIPFAISILKHRDTLKKMGLKRNDIISGYTKSVNKVLEILGEHVKISENMVVQQIFISRMRMRTSQQFNQKNLNSLILEVFYSNKIFISYFFNVIAIDWFICLLAGSQVLRNPMSVNLDEIYVAKILGVDSRKSCVVRGILLKSDDVGSTIRRVENAKVAVVPDLVHTAEQVENFGKTKEAVVEALIKAIADSGAKVIVSRSSICKMTLNLCELYKIMVLQITSEIDFTSFCCKAGAVASSQLFLPQHLGYTDSISITEIDGARLMIAEIGNSSTIVLCGTKWSLLNKQERYITQGIDTYKGTCISQGMFRHRDRSIVPWKTAMELLVTMKVYAKSHTRLENHAISKFVESLEYVLNNRPDSFTTKSLIESTKAVCSVLRSSQILPKQFASSFEEESGFDLKSRVIKLLNLLLMALGYLALEFIVYDAKDRFFSETEEDKKRAAEKAERAAERAAEKAERAAERAAEKAERDKERAERALQKLERKKAEKKKD